MEKSIEKLKEGIKSLQIKLEKQELENSIKNMKHGEWYKINTISNNSYIIKFDKLLDNIHVFALKGYVLKRNVLISTNNICTINLVKSLSPATQQEVEQYFPNEFKQFLFTTEDNVIIYEGDLIYCLETIDGLKLKGYITANKNTTLPSKTTIKYFSTEEKAQAYLDSLKPKKDYEIIDYLLNPMSGTKTNVIRSIKRLSDGEVFTIGDKVEHKTGADKGIINEFVNLKDNVTLIAKFIGSYHYNPNFQFQNNISVIRKQLIKEETLLEKAVDSSTFTSIQLATINQIIDDKLKEIKQTIKELQ